MQDPELPNGCEITSLTAIFNYYDKEINKLTMVEKYLPKEPITVVNGTNELHTPYKNLHAVVLLGLDEEYAYIMKPLTGYEYVHISTLTAVYETLERKAVVVY